MGLLGTIGGALLGDIGSGIGSAVDSFIGQDSANNYSSAQAAATRDWQTQMSNTSYQRTMADMKAAGLNPMLAYSQGGNSVPTGATAGYSQYTDSSAMAAAAGKQAEAAYRTSGAAVTQADSSQLQAIAAYKNAETAEQRLALEKPVIQLSWDKMHQEIMNLGTENSRLMASAMALDEQRRLWHKQGLSLEVQNDLTQKLAAKAVAETQLSDLDIKAAATMNNFGREAGQVRPLVDLLISLIHARR